ncbi:methyltransferase [Calothrix sp. PCC 7716]|nr:methyltransferase [Calothrix sp. PCC 7716]
MVKKAHNGDCYYDLVVDTYNLFHPEGNINDAPFYKSLIDEVNGAVLEMMCGSGRVLIPLLRQGVDIDGLDCSNEMLASCREKAQKEGLHCNLYEQFTHEMELPRRYKTVLFSYSSFALLTDRTKAFETLRKISVHLENEGQLILDMSIPWLLTEEASNGMWKLSRKGMLPDNRFVHISQVANHNRLEQLEHLQIKYEVYTNSKLTDTLLTEMQCRYYGKYELQLLLERAGFCRISTYGDFKNREPEDGDRVITFRCFKKHSMD